MLHLLKDSEGRLHELSSYELVVLLTALARTRTKPPAAWLERYFAASLPHLPTHGPGYLYMLLRCAAGRCSGSSGGSASLGVAGAGCTTGRGGRMQRRRGAAGPV